MKNTLFKKGLVVGIIILFIGLAFIPTYNAVSISKDIEKTNTVRDNTKEGCIECQSNDKIHLAEKLLTKLEENEELSNIIDTIKPQGNRPVCIFLEKLWNNLMALYISLIELSETYPEGSIGRKMLEEMAFIVLGYGYTRVKSIWAFTFNCEESVS